MIANHSHPSLFPIDLVAKDFRYLCQSAQDLGAKVPSMESTLNIYRQAAEQGFGANHITGVGRLYLTQD